MSCRGGGFGVGGGGGGGSGGGGVSHAVMAVSRNNIGPILFFVAFYCTFTYQAHRGGGCYGFALYQQ